MCRMKDHFSQYEPLMVQLKHKYQVSQWHSQRPLDLQLSLSVQSCMFNVQAITREKMLASLERDRAVSEVYIYMHVCHCQNVTQHPPSDVWHTCPALRWPTSSQHCSQYSKPMENHLLGSHTPHRTARQLRQQQRFDTPPLRLLHTHTCTPEPWLHPQI